MAKITPVIMSGGAGTRLWPVSRVGAPKQFHALGGQRTMIQETALRASGEGFEPPIVICNESHAAIAGRQLAEAGLDPLIVLEPVARNTAACAVAAAALVAERDPDGLVLLAPADHVIKDLEAYRAAIETGRPAAEAGKLVVFGLRPDRPETGYGYIRAASSQGAVRPVAAFVEKPDLATARAYVADPDYTWNAGFFLFGAKAFLDEARRLAPEVAAAAEAAVATAARRGREVRLGEAFGQAPAISVDYAVFEKTDKAVVAPCELGWSDVGAWRALWELADQADDQNALHGDVVSVASAGCLVRTDGPTVALAGVQDLVVIVENGVVLVAAKDDPAAVKALVEQLKAKGRADLL
ncbi:mannose-1-phosphate guanylyltransferase/mannose-6-phosphate isomerase [Phenylobacterium soli]|uniref:mannose-1-phosphate guanylyltransferase n=1 Tax=Phenylobacterium soli TaxID=2170551 RepID=A0A328AFK7_9CAUL|nr:mannose-1-phosphate guanylyltransferase/mannose-6-phosphate isomerase [Phenylobacterium soli]RAK53401.1 mannose-1-phosphate guanylyltransferase/mannose-6-phosphate isomerase [Phenylobacterium soli]